jgi:uncharacterized membrane protein
MPSVFSFLLFMHIACGAAALFTGLILLFIIKGNRLHRQLGRLFSASLLSCGGLALIMSTTHPNLFLALLGLFTLYMVGMGHRYARRKKAAPKLLDLSIALGIALTGIVLAFLAVRLLIKGNQMGWVLAAFGGLALMYAVQDCKALILNPLPNSKRIQLHLQRMLGALIASISAFLVVNYRWFPEELPAPILWLFPTFVLTPILVFWSRRVERGYGPAQTQNHEKANEV